MNTSMDAYPATLSIDYPETANRLTTFFRLFMIIPAVILLSLLRGILTFPTFLLILFRQKYPRWWFDWNLNLTRYSFRINAYALLLQHEYPSTDEEQGVHIEIAYPEAKTELNRWMPLVKWLLVIPHIIVIYVLGIVAALFTFIAWFAILFTGRYPEPLFNFVVGVVRWGLRIQAYVSLLATDKYPPFSLD